MFTSSHSVGYQSISVGRPNHLSESTPNISMLNEVVIPSKQAISTPQRAFSELSYPHTSMGLMRAPTKAKANWLKAFAYAKNQAKDAIRAQANWRNVFNATQKLVKGAFEDCLVIQETYYLETLDPRHEYAATQLDYFQDWVEGADYLSGDVKANYFTFIELDRVPLSRSNILYDQLWKVKDPDAFVTDGNSPVILDYERLKKSWVYTGAEDGASYLVAGVDQFTAEESAKHFGVSIEGQKVLFSSSYHEDWANKIQSSPHPSELIFVTDKEGKIYAGFKERAIFHHSSFLSGAPVAMAGTLVVDSNGKLCGVSNLSGHYQPTEKHCIRFLHQLRQMGVELNHLNFIFAKLIDDDIRTFRGNAGEWLRANSEQDRLHDALQTEVKLQFEI
jgi:hypothetical protein